LFENNQLAVVPAYCRTEQPSRRRSRQFWLRSKVDTRGAFIILGCADPRRPRRLFATRGGCTKVVPRRPRSAQEDHGGPTDLATLTVESLCLDGCPQTFFFFNSSTVTFFFLFYSPTVGRGFCLIKVRSCKTLSARTPLCTVPCVICVHWVGWQPLHLTCHAPMRTQKQQVAVLGHAHTKSRAEHTGVCAVARGIHSSFRSAIRLRRLAMHPCATLKGSRSTVGPRRPVTVEAKRVYGRANGVD
jgi:hypothetical protein